MNYFVLTGDPGVGKTTLTKKLCSSLNKNDIKTVGFITEEVRRNRVREGFDIVALNGLRGRLARDQSLLDVPTKYAVGKYGVLIEEFESIALQSLHNVDVPKTCLIIDEIGKMELFSVAFKNKVKEIFSNNKYIVVATIPSRKSDALIESIRCRSKVWTVTRENRNNLHEEIMKEITSCFSNSN
ncbi:nucleoside-triphosphatase THEP1 [Leptidea sinapis]|uniref:nucleoside-triphosphatase THEP1 n=1 Tax=Leptidea sinapis TaxID=189913 RepID=UPI0021C3D0BB|nr:nucleoside-triphosphatase THEP1 [Leptidea sinapis]